MTCGGWGETFSQNSSSLALKVWQKWCFEGSEEKGHLINQCNDKGVCRTAPATHGLLERCQLNKRKKTKLSPLFIYILLINNLNLTFVTFSWPIFISKYIPKLKCNFLFNIKVNTIPNNLQSSKLPKHNIISYGF